MERKPQNGARAPASSQEIHPNLSNAIERGDDECIPSLVPGTGDLSMPNPQHESAISTHYPALAFRGTITVSQANTTNVAQDTTTASRRPGAVSDTLTREQTMNSKPSFYFYTASVIS